MSIVIESGFAVPSVRRVDKNKITPSLKGLMDHYGEAYLKVYGVRPTIAWENPWFRIVGQEARVSRQRLRELTRQLEYRAG